MTKMDILQKSKMDIIKKFVQYQDKKKKLHTTMMGNLVKYLH